VVLEDGARQELLLDQEDPARALADLRRIVRELKLEVRPGWGLTDLDLHLAEHSAPARLTPIDVQGPRWQGQRRATLASFLGSLFILGVTVFTFSRVAAPASTLANVLPVLFALLIFFASLLLWTMRVRVRVREQGLRLDTCVFHWNFKIYEISARDLLGAQAVAAGTKGPQHVLLETSSGPRAIPIAGPVAKELARAIARASSEPKDPRIEWTPPARDQVLSLEENPC
jgi:hypothetical protein